jgi:multidrug efflux pump subunit AcrB
VNIAEASIKYSTITWVVVVLLVVAGVIAYQQLPRLEDPEFTIKDAVVITPYPGATAEEVEEEVTEVIEKAAQQLGQLRRIKRSISERGRSTVYVEIKQKYDKRALPQIWDELRRKIGDAQGKLPPGAGPSLVNDDFGDVFGVYLAIHGDGYSYAELKEYAKFLQRELLLVQDVKRIDLTGVQQEVVFVEMSRNKMANLGVTPEDINQALADRNLATPSGSVRVGPDYVPIDPTGVIQSVEDMKSIVISEPGAMQLITLGDVADVRRDYVDPAQPKLRVDGMPELQGNSSPAIGLAISTVLGGNVVTMGDALNARLEELRSQQPVGIEREIVSYQPTTVRASVNGFVVNLVQAVAIVIVVLLIFMGLRSGLIIGAILALTIAGTLVIMNFYAITLERISLGALIIALGMLVDNCIVVVEGMLIRIERGDDRVRAAKEVVAQNQWPLLGATVIAVVSFGAIGLSQDSTGEYCRSLFTVLLISLMFSWVTAITATPLFCVMFLKGKDPDKQRGDPYGGFIFQLYRQFLILAIRFRYVTVGIVVGLLAISLWAFNYIDQSFFPPSTRNQFIVDMWLPRGTHIDVTEKQAEYVENHIKQEYPDEVSQIATTIGSGSPRFLLTYTPEIEDNSYAQLLVQVKDYRDIDRMRDELQRWMIMNLPGTTSNVKKFLLGPGDGGKCQLRISGPDPKVLRKLADDAVSTMRAHGNAIAIRPDWRNRTKVVRPVLSLAQARRTGITRPDVCAALEIAYHGKQVGLYREGDELLPILSRLPEAERGDVNNLKDTQVYSPALKQFVPIRQVVREFEMQFEDPLIYRRNRIRTVTIHCDPLVGNASVLRDELAAKIDSHANENYPPGYHLEWGGEYESSNDASKGLAASLPGFLVLMVLTVIVLFNALRQPAIIWLCVPLAMIGVSAGLLATGQPFGFMALLGTMSLVGMMIKNSIVLLDEIRLQVSLDKPPLTAVIQSGVSRMRPVSMAALTTVLGMVPLLSDAFFIAMAVAIMCGLTFATILTLVIVPVFYVIFFNVKYDEELANA